MNTSYEYIIPVAHYYITSVLSLEIYVTLFF